MIRSARSAVAEFGATADSPDLPDDGLAYETGLARVRAMYELPTAGDAKAVLELVLGRAPTLPTTGWPSAIQVHDLGAALEDFVKVGENAPSAQLLPFASGAFDLVVLHGTLDDVARQTPRASRFAALLLADVHRVLRSGGAVAACARNRLAVRVEGLIHGRWKSAGVGGIRTYRRLLVASNFAVPRLYSLTPEANAPRQIVSVERRAARAMAWTMLQVRGDFLSRPAFVARSFVVALALDRWFAPTLFFYASKR